LDRARPYDALVYQMGNSPAHAFAYETLMTRPGVVVLHDLALASFHYELALSQRSGQGGGGLEAFRRLLEKTHPDQAEEFTKLLRRDAGDPEFMVRKLTESGFDMNRRIVEQASAVIVHSHAARGRLGPVVERKVFTIPLGAASLDPAVVNKARVSVRERLSLSKNTLVIAAFGSLHPSKLNSSAINEFAEVARLMADSVLLFVGEEVDGGLARRRAAEVGLSHRVQFLGRVNDEEFLGAAAATDIGLALRRPPTNGESSAALLDLLRSGVATIVTDVGSFSEFPDHVVRKVTWNDEASVTADLSCALQHLATNLAERTALGRGAREYIRELHAWPIVAAKYAEVIAWAADRGRAKGFYRGPHSNRPRVRQEGHAR
jgi:glycosyltransferase involved in cell wall biosynthesis